MDNVIQQLSAALAWLMALDNQNKLILGGGLVACMLLLNWLWKKTRGYGAEEDEAPERRAYVIPSKPLHRATPRCSPHRTDEDFTQYTDVSYNALPLMSQTEINFWCLLYQAVPGHHIFPQMATSALVNVASSNGDHFRNVLKAFSTSRVDFVVCDAKLNVLALVELDDASHDNKKEKDRRRDFINAQAGYKTVRFDCRNWPNVEQIKKQLFFA